MRYIKLFEISNYAKIHLANPYFSPIEVKIGDTVVCIRIPSYPDYNSLKIGKKYKIIDVRFNKDLNLEEIKLNVDDDADKSIFTNYLTKNYFPKFYFTSEYEWIAKKYNL